MDKLLKMFFEDERWGDAIDKAVGKEINYSELRNLKSPETRIKLLMALTQDKYRIAPPHMALIPKDNGDFRTVYVNEPIDRVFLSISNDLLCEVCPDMIHPQSKAYQTGIGCGKVVQEVSEIVARAKGAVIGWKADLTKYFDSVPIRYIDRAYDMVEERHGKSAIINVLRAYAHQDLCFDVDGNLISHYQSLKQGCAVASWLANVVLYDIDEKMSQLNGYYVRYSDDTLFVGPDYEKALHLMRTELEKMELTLNPKKVEAISSQKWVKFLGFSIKGDQISISKNRLKTFQKEIEFRSIRCKGITKRQCINKINRYLYVGDGKHSWAEQMLGIVNCNRDIELMNMYVMDCIRAVERGKKKVGGLGYEHHTDGVVTRGIGRHVKANRNGTNKEIDGYYTLGRMQDRLLTHPDLYRATVSQL